jgi:creatinine amidohydrolase
MRVVDANWMHIAEYLKHDDRGIVPLGSTEQHAYLSLLTDSLLSERVAVEAAEPLGVPVFPALVYGISGHWLAFPGSVALRVGTYLSVIRDVLDSLHGEGFRRILLVNGHGGNSPAGAVAQEWMADHPQTRVLFKNWYEGPRTLAAFKAVGPVGAHAGWGESFPWNRAGPVPTGEKPWAPDDLLRSSPPVRIKEVLGDGMYGGEYSKSDEEMLRIWQVAVEEMREIIESL